MSTIIKSELFRKVIKFFIILIASSLGLRLFTLIIQMTFNLGNHVGVFFRVLYNAFCH